MLRLPKDEVFAAVLEQAKKAGLVPAEVEVSQAQRFVEAVQSRLSRYTELHTASLPGSNHFI